MRITLLRATTIGYFVKVESSDSSFI